MKVCLIAIVGDGVEACLPKALDSMKGLFDCWSICFNGKNRKIKDIILDKMKGVPGKLHITEWADHYGEARTECFRLAEKSQRLTKNDWMFIIDSDDTFVADPGFKWPEEFPEKIACLGLTVTHGAMSQLRAHVFRACIGWEFLGRRHERAELPEEKKLDWINGAIKNAKYVSGEKVRPRERFLKDIVALKVELKGQGKKPEPRTQFYLAQSYFDAQMYAEADKWYQIRVDNEIQGNAEEQWYAAYRRYMCGVCLNLPIADIIERALLAFRMRPTRAEPLFRLSLHLRQNPMAYPFAVAAASIPRPKDTMFVEDEVYEWRAVDEACTAASWANLWGVARAYGEKTLAHAPVSEHERIYKNMAMFASHLGVQ